MYEYPAVCGFYWLAEYTDEFKSTVDSERDIVCVWDKFGESGRKLLWAKDGNLTANERSLLAMIPSKYKWIARNENGNLNCFVSKPHKRKDSHWVEFNLEESRNLKMFNDWFKFIHWEDAEPVNIAKLRKVNDIFVD